MFCDKIPSVDKQTSSLYRLSVELDTQQENNLYSVIDRLRRGEGVRAKNAALIRTLLDLAANDEEIFAKVTAELKRVSG